MNGLKVIVLPSQTLFDQKYAMKKNVESGPLFPLYLSEYFQSVKLERYRVSWLAGKEPERADDLTV